MAKIGEAESLNLIVVCTSAVLLSLLLACVVHVAVERPFMAIRDRVAPEKALSIRAQA